MKLLTDVRVLCNQQTDVAQYVVSVKNDVDNESSYVKLIV